MIAGRFLNLMHRASRQQQIGAVGDDAGYAPGGQLAHPQGIVDRPGPNPQPPILGRRNQFGRDLLVIPSHYRDFESANLVEPADSQFVFAECSQETSGSSRRQSARKAQSKACSTTSMQQPVFAEQFDAVPGRARLSLD